MKFVIISSLISIASSLTYLEYSDSKGNIEQLKNELTYTDSTKAVELGKLLFYEKILSRDSSTSCSSCHQPQLAFTDGLSTSIGFRNQRGARNAPTLTNVKDHPILLLDGVNPTLESQVLVPFQEHKEFDLHILLGVERIKQIEKYVRLSKEAYNREPDAFVLTHSIATFERTLVGYDSPYDQFLAGNKEALSPSQIRGKRLFFETLYCGECHTGKNLTNYSLTNNGLYEVYADSGRMRLTEIEEDRAVFKVPTLRNVAITAPYMHNGSVPTLYEVIEHYSTGGKNHKNKSPIIKPFTLTQEEKHDLVNFLNAFTDTSFINHPNYYLSF